MSTATPIRLGVARLIRTCASCGAATLVIAGAGLLSPELRADTKSRGSVRHSGASSAASRTTAATGARGSAASRTTVATTPAGTTASRTTVSTHHRRPAYGHGHHGHTRAAYRAGYHHGRYTAHYDAWRSYYRWRTAVGLVRLGTYYASQPKQSTTVVVSGGTYYYSGGVYYQQTGSGYTVVAAPQGAVVYAVPTYTTVVYSGTTPYYYSAGTFYVPTDKPADKPPEQEPTEAVQTADAENAPPEPPEMTEDDHNYEVVDPPVGATVTYLPEEADQESVGGTTYYVYDGTFYQPFASGDETIYMVVNDPRA